MTQVLINYISGGTFPIDVYIADKYGNNKTLIGSVSSGPVPPVIKFNVTIPSIFNTAEIVMLILSDTNNCEVFKLLECPDQTMSVCLIFQDNREMGTQGTENIFLFSDQICAQQDVSIYTITSGFSTAIEACSSSTFVDNVYSPVGSWAYIITSYYDSEMNVPFYGDSKWYKSKNSNTALRIDSQGYVIGSHTC